MSTFRKFPDRVLVDKDGTDVASTASNAVFGEQVTADGTSATDNTAAAVKVLQVNAAGGTTGVTSSVPVFSVLTASTAAVAFATNPAAIYRLLRVEAQFDTAATAAENLTVTIDAGDGEDYDSLIYSESMSALVATNVSIPFGRGYEYEADDDVDVAFTNSEANTISVRTVYELL